MKIYAAECVHKKMSSYYKLYNDFLKLKIGNSFLKSTQTKEEDDIYWLKLNNNIFSNLILKKYFFI